MGNSAVVYRGYGNDNPAGGRLVMVEVAGDASPLPHHVKHSPTGMSWGYHGSGGADLARSLLIHALGDAARCRVCNGSGEVGYDVVTNSDVPARVAEYEPPSPAGESRYSDVMGCQECEGGCRLLPAVYQSFKRDVVARLPDDGWSLTRTEILQWAEQHHAVK